MDCVGLSTRHRIVPGNIVMGPVSNGCSLWPPIDWYSTMLPSTALSSPSGSTFLVTGSSATRRAPVNSGYPGPKPDLTLSSSEVMEKSRLLWRGLRRVLSDDAELSSWSSSTTRCRSAAWRRRQMTPMRMTAVMDSTTTQTISTIVNGSRWAGVMSTSSLCSVNTGTVNVKTVYKVSQKNNNVIHAAVVTADAIYDTKEKF